MAPGTNPINPVVDTLDTILNDILKTLAMKEAYALIIAAVPFLGWPVIGIFTGWLLAYFGGKLFAVLQKYIDFTAIKWQTDVQAAAYENAVAQLKQAQASGDPNALTTAKTTFSNTLRDLIHLNGN